MSVSDKVVALNFGRKIGEGPPAVIQSHPEVIAAYLGTEAA
jgi:branched-chain amino acid transport system ATP-binding protein